MSNNHLPRTDFSLVWRNIFLTRMKKCENSAKIRDIIYGKPFPTEWNRSCQNHSKDQEFYKR